MGDRMAKVTAKDAEIERLREVIREAHQHWVDGDEYGCFQILNSAENTRYEKTARETYS